MFHRGWCDVCDSTKFNDELIQYKAIFLVLKFYVVVEKTRNKKLKLYIKVSYTLNVNCLFIFCGRQIRNNY